MEKKSIEKRYSQGFTLVELVVVIAIIAILAGVGGAAYSGYITRANDAKALVQLDAILTATLSAVADDQPAVDVTKITVATKDGTIDSIKINDTGTDMTGNADFELLFGSNGKAVNFSNTSYEGGAVWRAKADDNNPAGWSKS